MWRIFGKIKNEEKLVFVDSSKHQSLSNVGNWFIVLSLIVALVLNLLPLQGIALSLRPDCVALLVLYWSINQPQRVGIGASFIMGLMMDVGDASMLGQHALSYSVMSSIALLTYRRLHLFSIYKQIPQVTLLLLSAQLVMLLTGILINANLPEWDFLLASVSGALLWPLLPTLVRILQRQRPDSEVL